MEKKKKIRNRWFVIGLIVILIFVGLWFLLQHMLKNEISKAIEKGLIRGHILEAGKIETDLLSASVSAMSLSIYPDPAWESGQETGIRIDTCSVDTLSIRGINAFRYLLFKELSIQGILLGKTFISLSVSDVQERDDFSGHHGKSQISKIIFKSLNVSDLGINVHEMETGRKMMSVNSLKLTTGKLKIGVKSGKDMKISYPDIERLDIDTLQAVLSDGFYKAEIGQIRNTGGQDFNLREIKLLPQYKKYSFSKRLGYQTDRIKLLLDELNIRGFDYKKLEDKIIRCEAIEGNAVFADFFRDKNMPRKPGHRPPMPQQMITGIPYRVCIDSISMNRNEVHYIEHVPGAPEAGFVFFDDLNLLVLNVNNDPAYFKKANTLRVFATGSVMGESLAKLKISFPASKSPDTIFFSGSLKNMNLNSFNTMLERNKQVRINKGYLDELSFDAMGNNDFATGKMSFLYHDLNITVLKQEAEIAEERKFLSFLMNTFLRSNNPAGKKSPLIAEMGFERDKEKSFINYMWKTVLSGIAETITPGKSKLERKKK